MEAELGYLRADVKRLTLENQQLRDELTSKRSDDDNSSASHLEELVASLTNNWHAALHRAAKAEEKLANEVKRGAKRNDRSATFWSIFARKARKPRRM